MNNYQEVLEFYIEATNTHVFDNIEKILSKEATYFFSDKSCSTFAEIRSYFENSWNTIKDENYWIDHVRWIVKTQDTAVCIYNYHYEGNYKGKKIKGGGKATNIFIKELSEWKLIHEHLSS